MPITLTSSLIAAHERIFPRLAALLKQVERARPTAPVPEETVRLSRTLCRDAKKLLGREGQSIGLPGGKAGKGALDHQGLAVVLGQVVAGLEAFEAAHSGWSAERKCTVWRLDGPPRPVTRLLPPGSDANPVETNDAEAKFHRRQIAIAFMARFAAGYDAGYRDAKQGLPPQSGNAENIWDDLVEKEGGMEQARRAGMTPPRIRYSNPPAHLVPEGAVMSDPKTRQRW